MKFATVAVLALQSLTFAAAAPYYGREDSVVQGTSTGISYRSLNDEDVPKKRKNRKEEKSRETKKSNQNKTDKTAGKKKKEVVTKKMKNKTKEKMMDKKKTAEIKAKREKKKILKQKRIAKKKARKEKQKQKRLERKKKRQEKLQEKLKTRNFFSLLNAAQEISTDGSAGACESNAIGNAVATLKGGNEFCIMLSYGLAFSKLPEVVSHIHGPANIGENGPAVLKLSPSPTKTDCFKLTKKQRKQLLEGKWYFNIHSKKCPAGEIRGQIMLQAEEQM